MLLDADLAKLYGIEVRALVQAVKRNVERFPADFMFQLRPDEVEALRSQTVISKIESSGGRGGRRTMPYAFTEQGVAMLSSVLRSERAVAVNIAIMRAFVHLRRMLDSTAELARKFDELERRVTESDIARDAQIAQIVEAIRQLMQPPAPPRRPLGFRLDDDR
ncbi:MAG: ORF6N domain-containing protein [Thermoleophilia bacterium]|nr:ORF6N domain-containing protein [Thermoleophilia bacterium]